MDAENFEYLVEELESNYPDFEILDIDNETMAKTIMNQHYFDSLNDKEIGNHTINDIKAVQLMRNIVIIARHGITTLRRIIASLNLEFCIVCTQRLNIMSHTLQGSLRLLIGHSRHTYKQG